MLLTILIIAAIAATASHNLLYLLTALTIMRCAKKCHFLIACLTGPTAILKDWKPKDRVDYVPHDFDIHAMTPGWCKRNLRFSAREVEQLAYILAILGKYSNRYTATSTIALAVVLFRLWYPRRLFQYQNIFGHSEGWVSAVFNGVCIHLDQTFAQKLKYDCDFLTLNHLSHYCY
jgi:hypothetical protein